MGGEEAPRRRRNPRGQGQVLRAELIAAAAHLLATLDQPETLTLRQVAREVGVAPASIYSHFPDLGSLVRHVLRLRYAELARLMDEAAAPAADPLDDLAGRCAAYVRWGVEHPGEYRTLFGGRMPADLALLQEHGAGEALLDSVIASLAAVRQRGGERSDPARQWRNGLLLWTGLHGLVVLHNDHGELPWPPLDALLADLLGLHAGRSAEEFAARLAAG